MPTPCPACQCTVARLVPNEFLVVAGGCGGGSRVPSARAVGAERELPPNPATWEDIGEHLWRRVDIIAATHLLYLNEPSCSFAPALAGVLVTEPSKGTRNEEWNSSRIQGAGAIDDDDGTPSSLPLHALLFRVADQSTANMAINGGRAFASCQRAAPGKLSATDPADLFLLVK